MFEQEVKGIREEAHTHIQWERKSDYRYSKAQTN